MISFFRKLFKIHTPTVTIEWIDGWCPVQAEGQFNTIPFYFRARGEKWSIEVGKYEPRWYYSEPYGIEKFDASWMSHDDAIKFIHKSAILWQKTKKSR